MINFYDVLIELLPKVWYFLPLIIVLSFIKIYIEKEKRRKAQKEFHLKNEENGKKFEKLTGKRFEELGYKVIYNGLEKGKLDQGIDLICYKENEILLIQCKNYTKSNSITHEDIKIFHSNAIKYIKIHNLNEKSIKLKYSIPNIKILDISAKKTLSNNFYNCTYVIVKV